MGGTASLVVASKEGKDIDVVVTLSAPTAFEGLEAGHEVLAQVTAAKLFIAGHEDVGAVRGGGHRSTRESAAAEAAGDPHDR